MAAYPVIDFLVDPATVRVVAKEIHTVERTITQGEEISTGFAETTGQSTTVGTIDTNTHSTWQENSTTEGGIEPGSIITAIDRGSTSMDSPSVREFVPATVKAIVSFDKPSGVPVVWADWPRYDDSYLGYSVAYPPDAMIVPSDKSRGIIHATIVNSQAAGSSGEPDLTNLEFLTMWSKVEVGIFLHSRPIDVRLTDWAKPRKEDMSRFLGDRSTSISGFQVYQQMFEFDGQYVLTTYIPRGEAIYFISTTLREPAIPSEIATLIESFAFTGTFEPDLPVSSTLLLEDDVPNRIDDGTTSSFRLPFEGSFPITNGPGEYLHVTGTPAGEAIDFPMPIGTPVRAAETGTVAFADWNSTGYGWSIQLHHADGSDSWYAHLNNIPNNLPTSITKGNEFAQSGNSSGRDTTGPHLHFHVFKGTKPVCLKDLPGVWWNTSYPPGDPNLPSGCASYPPTSSAPAACRSGARQLNCSEFSSPFPANACYAPGMTSAITGQPVYFNQSKKPTLFNEVIGKLKSIFTGKNVRSGNMAALAMTPDSFSGCSGSSCSDQVGHQSSSPLNFSNNRSGGQCASPTSLDGTDYSGFGGGGAGIAVNDNGDGTWDRLRVWSETTTTGEGNSTSHSELRSNTDYSEITRSETNTLVSSEAWATASTVDPTDAATLTFNYNLYNTGSDAAVQLTGIRTNILIGDLPVITWNAPDRADILPGQAKGPFSSDPIHLSLDQLAAIDNGAPIRVVLADYGYNDSLYDQNAWGNGVLFHVDDGIADGDESVDTYLITTQLVQDETYQDTLARYFPVDVFDAGPDDERTGTLTNIRTPEFDGNGEITEWNDHRVGEHGWWELAISLEGETDGVEHFKDMPAKKKNDVYLRYVEDSDGDGYSDRAELDGNADPNNPEIHPRPLLVAAQHTEVSGSNATVQLALQNAGNFDASSVEVWAVAPDDSITITDNLIGGGGRVRAGGHVVLGSRFSSPDLTGWPTGTAKPYPGGQYTGLTPKTYTFRADGNGNIGSTPALTISWNSDGSTWMPLNVGNGYNPLSTLPLADGLTIAFTTGYIANGETFSFQTALPIDTFAYTINSTPPTPPMIVVSYNDPEGNHKFVSAVEIDAIQEDLTGHLGQMRYGFQMDIMGEAPVMVGANTAYLEFNNPSDQTISEGQLFIEFAKPDGTVVKEYVLSGQTLQPGPNVATLNWDTDDFNPAYDPVEDYHILVFAADRQGTIFENTVKKLSQVGHDQLPLAVLPDSTWDFGIAQQGTLLRRTVAVANVGYHDLMTFVEASPGLSLSLSQQGTRYLPAGDLTFYDLALHTQEAAVGPYQSTVKVRTNDPANPTRTITIQGEITPMSADTPPGEVQRPLDWPATFASGTQGQWVEYTHTLGPDPQTLHPVKVFSSDYATLWGVGRYATAFGAGTAPGDMFGDGRDGVMPSSGNLDNNNGVGVGVVNSGSQGSYSINVTDAYAGWRINPGDAVLIHQTQGSGAGCWELNKAVSDYAGGTATIQLAKPVQCNYVSGGNNHAQVQRVPQYTDCSVSGSLTPLSGWNGTWGGIFSAVCSNSLNVSGTINASAYGFRGGSYVGNHQRGYSGEGNVGPTIQTFYANGSGGGGGENASSGDAHASGGGGGNGAAGTDARQTHGNFGRGGTIVGSANLSSMHLGGGGGGSACGWSGCGSGSGGNGGGIVFVVAKNVGVTGWILAQGANGQNGDPNGWAGPGSGGGGAGGSIKILTSNAAVSTNRVDARYGFGGYVWNGGIAAENGRGGTGRVAIDYCDTFSGETIPSAITQKLTCFITEQVVSSPYDRTRLNFPETFSTSRTYQVQYGRRMVYSGAANQDVVLRVPAGVFNSATLDALISDVGAGSLTIRVDIGNDGNGVWDWEWSSTVNNAYTHNDLNLTAAFNRYWTYLSTRPLSGMLDVPVRVYLSKPGQVLLTDVKVTSAGSKLRHARLPAQTYSEVVVSMTAGQSGSDTLTVAADVGDNGSVDWAWSGSATYPQALTSDDLASAVNAFLQGQTGDVDVPIRFYVSPFLDTALVDVIATPVATPDLAIAPSDIDFGGGGSVTEGNVIPVTATIHNTGDRDSGPLTASFFATLPGGREWYIGSDFVPSVPAGSSSPAAIDWETLGFNGAVPVRVVVDPYDRLAESDEDNNQATASLTILTRPDLWFSDFALSDGEPVEGETITVAMTLSNDGQTAAGASTLALYDGHPDSGGVLICENTPTVAANGQTTVECPWTAGAPGLHRLYAETDQDNVIGESNEGNNARWHDVYVGFAGPLLLDSGTAGEQQYTTANGYGYVDEGQPDSLVSCGTQPHQTLRVDPGGRVVYRFDHLLPGHFYHLDVTLFKCDYSGRQEWIKVDTNEIAGPVDLGDGAVHGLSLLLDPALYADNAISVAIETSGFASALVAEVNLHDIDYRYADSGGANDPHYPGTQAYGWIVGAGVQLNPLPFKSARTNPAGNSVRYQFDQLSPDNLYNVNLTFWQPVGSTTITQKVQINSVDVGPAIQIGADQRVTAVVAVPPDQTTIEVGVVRTDAQFEALVNEIALEQLTLVTAPTPTPTPTPGPTGPVQMQLEPDSITVDTGATFVLDVMVDADTYQADTIELHIGFDPAKLQVVDGTGNPASTIVADLTSLNIELLNTVDNATGQIRYDAGKLSGTAPSGTFRVASIPFKALNESAGTEVSYLPDTDVFFGGSSVYGGGNGTTVVVQAGCLLGQVALQSHPNPAGYAPTVSLYDVGGSTVLGTYNTTLDANSQFTVCGVAQGTYDIMVKGSHSLGSRRASVGVPSGVTPVNFCTLFEGDASGDNRVSGVDFSILAAHYNACVGNGNFDARADFTDDGCIRGADFSLLASNYNRIGPVACDALEAGSPEEGSSNSVRLSGAADLAFDPSTQVVGIGEIFTLSLIVDAEAQPLNNVELYIDFDPSVLQVVDAAGNPVSSIDPDLTTLETLLYNSVDNGGGHIRYDAGRLGGTPPQGTFRVAVARFVRIAPAPFTTVRYVYPSDVFFDGNSVVASLGSAPVADSCPNLAPPQSVGIEDLQLVAAHWGEQAGGANWDPRFDLNADGRIDVTDVMIVSAFWNFSCA